MKREIITLKMYREMINNVDLNKYENVPVVASGDDEGNAFNRIMFAPTIMEDVEVYNDSEVTFKKAICIN